MRKLYFVGTIIILLLGEMNVGLFAQTVRYVKPVTVGTGDGSSWGNASGDLSAVLATSITGDEVWMAAGTYIPGDGSSRDASFVIPSGIKLYGGFSGNETSINERNPEINQTILSGDIGVKDDVYDNIKSIIVINTGLDNVLDGLIIQDAFANSYFKINEPLSISGQYTYLPASTFGIDKYYITAEIRQAYPLDACSAVEDLSGKIALIQRGSCTFVSKALAAQNAGALAVVIFNNVEGDIPLMGGDDLGITIPVIAISLADGQAILTELNAGHTVVAEMLRGNTGGGMYIETSRLVIHNCSFSDNVSPDGSAIYSTNSQMNLTDCRFERNGSTWGTVFNYLSEVYIEGCYFHANHAQYGGAVYSSNSESVIKGCEFADNIVLVSAGGVYSFMGQTEMDSCIFTGNKSEFSGGILVSGENSRAQIDHCIISGNTATGGGAGVSVAMGQVRINNCFIYNNISMSDDTVSGSGGGVQLSQNAGVEIINSVIANNRAGGKQDDGGGGVMIYGGNLLMTHVTLVNNSTASLGGAIRVYDSSGAVRINNSIIWSNIARDDSADCISNTGGLYQIDYSDVQDPGLMSAGILNLNVDPLFIHQDNPPGDDGKGMTTDDGLLLQENSPLIGTGFVTAYTPEFDILGYPRSSPIDMGAYEFHTVESSHFPVRTDDVIIYPNPVTDMFNMAGCKESDKITIVNAVGQVIWTGSFNSFPLDAEDWARGIYVIRISNSGGFVTRKLIKD